MKKLTKNELYLLNQVLCEAQIHEGVGIDNALAIIYSKLNDLPLFIGMKQFASNRRNSIVYYRRPATDHLDKIRQLTDKIMVEAQDEDN